MKITEKNKERIIKSMLPIIRANQRLMKTKDKPTSWEASFNQEFLNSDKLTSAHQFKLEVEGRLPELFKQFVSTLLKEQRESLIEEIKQNTPTKGFGFVTFGELRKVLEHLKEEKKGYATTYVSKGEGPIKTKVKKKYRLKDTNEENKNPEK